MTRYLARSFVVASALCFGGVAHAADAEFLKSLDGQWAGKGSVKVEADSSPISVNCKFASDTTDSSMSLDGNCTGPGRRLACDRRGYQDRRQILQAAPISARSTGPAGLSGKRSGNALNLGIRWAKRRERRPLRQAAAGEGGRQRHAPDDDRYRSCDRARASSSARSTCAVCDGWAPVSRGLRDDPHQPTDLRHGVRCRPDLRRCVVAVDHDQQRGAAHRNRHAGGGACLAVAGCNRIGGRDGDVQRNEGA